MAKEQQKQPNVVWITCEDISPFIGAYGDKVVKTPFIDQLAKEGVRYTHAYTTAGVCAPSRSAIITGMYQTSIGTQHMRTFCDPKYQPVPPYSAVIPDYVKCFPEYLRKAGYYCTNNEKQDYQFKPPVTVWDENGPAASYRNRPNGRPFFSIFNLFNTHESGLFSRRDSLRIDPTRVEVPPIYPDTRIVRRDIARLLTNIEVMDKQVGEIIQMLKDDGVYDQTVIFFYSDHGGALPWMKREVLERGTHIPLIIRFPNGHGAGTVNDDLISSVDFAPTALSLTNIKIPSHMQGQAFLGSQKAKTSRKYVYAARDRMDTEYDRVRMVRNKRYRYLYNYMPEKIYYQNIEFRLDIPMMKELLQKREEGTLDVNQAAWFKTKPLEELYDVESDPHEMHNLINDPTYANTVQELRAAFQQWTKAMGDQSDVAEMEMIKQMWNGKAEPPTTATPLVKKAKGGIKLSCETKGASIGYWISKASALEYHSIRTWDSGFISGKIKNGDQLLAPPIWRVYNGEIIKLQRGDTLKVNAMRIGYAPAMLNYVGD
jgi:arylsulfatase A-like enzyme